MRHWICALLAAPVIFFFFAVAGDASAEVLTLRAPVDLRARPGSGHRIVATAPAGAELEALGEGARWTPVAFLGRRYFAPTAQLVAATPADAPGPDPTCDYGYPYSGSGIFFARPLAQARHGEPLGFLLGYHRFYPCRARP